MNRTSNKMATAEVRSYLERHRINKLFEVSPLLYSRLRSSEACSWHEPLRLMCMHPLDLLCALHRPMLSRTQPRKNGGEVGLGMRLRPMYVVPRNHATSSAAESNTMPCRHLVRVYKAVFMLCFARIYMFACTRKALCWTVVLAT